MATEIPKGIIPTCYTRLEIVPGDSEGEGVGWTRKYFPGAESFDGSGCATEGCLCESECPLRLGKYDIVWPPANSAP